MASTSNTHNADAWSKSLSEVLRPRSDDNSPVVVDLFAGCGGLALGFAAAGFRTIGYEKDEAACRTYQLGLGDPCIQTTLEVGSQIEPAEVVIGGPPCQPFSVGGNQRGHRDERDGFPAFLDVVEQLSPKIALLENVRGLMYRNRWYLEEALKRFQEMGYKTDFALLNALQYGVPQNRERVIVVATKIGWEWPKPTTPKPVTSGEALGPLAFQVPEGAKFLTESMDTYIAKYEKASACINPRDLHLNKPARTLTCRNLAGATGDMHRIRLPDGRRRMLTVREAARLQTFPDWFEFAGKEPKQLEMIGNAVPPLLGLALGRRVMEALQGKLKSVPPQPIQRSLFAAE